VVLPAVDEPEVVLEPLILPPPDDLEPRARLPRPAPEVLLPRPLPDVVPIVEPEVVPIEPAVVPMVEPDVVPIEPAVLPIVEPLVVPAVVPMVEPAVVPTVVLPLVVPAVVLPLVVPAVVPVVVWAKAAPEIRPRPRVKAAARSGRKICWFIIRKEKGKRKGWVLNYWPVVLLAAPVVAPPVLLPAVELLPVLPAVVPPAPPAVVPPAPPISLPVPAVEPPRSPVPAVVVPPVLAVPVFVLPAESVLMPVSPVPLLPPVVVLFASVEVPSLLPPQDVSSAVLRARAAKARLSFEVRINWIWKRKNVFLIRCPTAGSHAISADFAEETRR